jgi:hypothetical protein
MCVTGGLGGVHYLFSTQQKKDVVAHKEYYYYKNGSVMYREPVVKGKGKEEKIRTDGRAVTRVRLPIKSDNNRREKPHRRCLGYRAPAAAAVAFIHIRIP